MRQQQQDERVARLVQRHRAAVESPDQCQRLLEQLMRRKNDVERSGGGGIGCWLRRVAWLACRLVLLYAFCSVSLNCLESSFPSVSDQVRTGRTLSYLNLVYLKSYRWLTVQLGFYRSEFMHRRDREACLVPNPFYRPPAMCCECKPLSIARVRLNSPTGRDVFRGVVDRHANPFLVVDSGHRPVPFAELRRTALDAWQEVSAGSNRIASFPAGGGGPTSLSELVTPEQPPAAKLTTWTYGHMSAIRAMRRVVPRPSFIRPDVDYGFARAFYVFGEDPAGDKAPEFLGDLSNTMGLNIILGLHGSVQVTLSAKSECCPDIRGNVSATVEPGKALVVPSSCFWVHAARQSPGYAMFHLFSLFSSTGIKQEAPITGRVPETDDIADDY